MTSMTYRIGDFSQMTRLTVKTLHYYHEIGLLVPSAVEPSGYRWYDEASVARAQAIQTLKALEFPLDEIRELLAHAQDDHDLVEAAQRRLAEVDRRLAQERAVRNLLLTLIHTEGTAMKQETTSAAWVTLDPVRVASLRYRGRYDQIGAYYSRLFRLYGRFVAGAPLALYHDAEFRDADADIEACLVLRPEGTITEKDGAQIKVLPSQRVAQVVHQGGYDRIGEAYQRVFDFLRAEGATATTPSREVYMKGPGMILPRSPRKFVTLVQLPVN